MIDYEICKRPNSLDMQKERRVFEVIFEDGRLLYKMSKRLVDTKMSLEDTKWIFVLSTTGTLYVGQVSYSPLTHCVILHFYYFLQGIQIYNLLINTEKERCIPTFKFLVRSSYIGSWKLDCRKGNLKGKRCNDKILS